MRIDGYGGREGGTQFDHEVIKGLLATEIEYTDHFAPGKCVREHCGKTFRPRRKGNDFCSRACEFNTYEVFQ